MNSAPLERTEDIVSRSQLATILGDNDLGDIIPVCAGEWRKEPAPSSIPGPLTTGDHWRFWADKNWTED